MYITHQSLYYYTELSSVCVIFVAYYGMVNLLTISSNLNIYVDIYITNLHCVECQNTVDQTITKRYRIDIVSKSTISTAIQLIQQSWNDIVSISNRYRRYRQQYSWSDNHETISCRYQIDIDDIDSNRVYPTRTWRYRIDIDSNTVDTTGTWRYRQQYTIIDFWFRSTHDHEDRVRYWLTDAEGVGQPIPDKVFMVMSRPKSNVYYCFIKLSGIFLHKDWNIHSYCFLSRPLS